MCPASATKLSRGLSLPSSGAGRWLKERGRVTSFEIPCKPATRYSYTAYIKPGTERNDAIFITFRHPDGHRSYEISPGGNPSNARDAIHVGKIGRTWRKLMIEGADLGLAACARKHFFRGKLACIRIFSVINKIHIFFKL